MKEERKGIVLAVDDEPANLGVLFEYLKQADYRVLIAENGRAALERVKRARPDIVLLDIKMPDMDGFELYRRMKEIGLTADTPVIFLSVVTETMDKVRALGMHAVDYITKPFEPLEVVARVEKHLLLRNLRRQLEEQNIQLQQEIAEREQAEAALRQRNEEQVTINAIVTVVNQSPDLDYVLSTVLAETERALALPDSEIWLLDEAAGQLRPGAHHGLPDDFALEIPSWQLGVGLPGIVAQTTHPLLIEDLEADPRFLRERGKQYDLHSALGIPLRAQERLVGVMNFFAADPGRFTSELTALLVTLGHLVGTAIDNSRLYATLDEKSSYLDSILRSATEYAIVTTDLDLRITYFNPLAEEYYGCPAQDAIGRTIQEVCPWEQPADRLELGIEVIEQRGGHRYVMVREIEGEMRHFAARVSGIYEPDGALVGYARFSRDITEQSRAEAALRELSVIEERRRLARDLHDSITQSLHSLKLNAETALYLFGEGNHDSLERTLRILEGCARQAMSEMRLLLYSLRMSSDEDLDLVEMMRTRLETAERRLGLNTEFSAQGIGNIPKEQEIDIFFVAVEALNNVLKHAQAKRVAVVIQATPYRVTLQVEDDGRGFNPDVAENGGLGLHTMQERAANLGAVLSIDSKPGRGTVVCLEIDLTHRGELE